MAVRNTKAANELIQRWQIDSEGFGIALNVEVMYMIYGIFFLVGQCVSTRLFCS